MTRFIAVHIRRFIYLLICIWSFEALGKNLVLISSEKTALDKFKLLTAKTPCEKINKFDTQDASMRSTLDLIFICRALNLANFEAELVIKEMPNYSRALERAASGNVNMPAETVWNAEIDNSLFYKSDPIVRYGEMEQGVFTLPTNTDLLKVSSLQELRNFSAVSHKRWIIDWRTLNNMGLKEIHSVSNLKKMHAMINEGKADFMLWSFSYSDASFGHNLYDTRLIPVPKIKIGMQGERRFVVSKKSFNAKIIYQALQDGIRKLRDDGFITQAYRQSGFFQPPRLKWQRIFPEKMN